MSQVMTLWKKEAWGHALSARSYAMLALLLSFTSLWFWLANLTSARDASLRAIIGLLSFLLMAITPILTMRTIAEEANRGTLELLLTSPIREWEIVLGKFLGALTLYLAIFAATLVYPLVLFMFSEPQGGIMIAQYVGMIGLSMAFISVGIFASSVTDSQVLAAVIGYIVLLTFWVIHWLTGSATGWIADAGKGLSLIAHLDRSNRGVIDAVDVFYFLAFTAVFLTASHRFIEARRWT